MCSGNLIPISDQNMWFSDPYSISELKCCPRESSMCPGNLIPISDQNMWFSLPKIRTELLSSRVQHVSWKPYSYFRSIYVIFSTLYQNWTAVLEGPACVLETLSLLQTILHVYKEISNLEFTWLIEFISDTELSPKTGGRGFPPVTIL